MIIAEELLFSVLMVCVVELGSPMCRGYVVGKTGRFLLTSLDSREVKDVLNIFDTLSLQS